MCKVKTDWFIIKENKQGDYLPPPFKRVWKKAQ